VKTVGLAATEASHFDVFRWEKAGRSADSVPVAHIFTVSTLGDRRPGEARRLDERRMKEMSEEPD
jgi:hypothetical protein